MFTDLQVLAQKSTLMIVVTSEGDQLRVSVTPTPNDKNDKQKLRPLSLVGSAVELDAGFAEALQIWQAPKQSIADQARAAAQQSDDDDDNDKKAETPTAKPKTAAKSAGKAPAKTPEKQPATKGKAAKTTLNPAAKWPFPKGDADKQAEAAPGSNTASAATDEEEVGGTSCAPIENDDHTQDAPATQPSSEAAAGNGAGLIPSPSGNTEKNAEPAPAISDPSPSAEPAKDDFTLELF